MVLETFKIRLDLDFFRGMLTGYGWYTVWMNDLSLFISLSILVLTVLCYDKNNIKLTRKQVINIFIIFTIICAIIYGAMLFGWTTTDWNSIDGLQPRYFIPAALLLYIILQNNKIHIKVKNPNLLYACSMIIINVLALITIISGFYV